VGNVFGQQEDPFVNLTPAQARAARIRRDRGIVAKARAKEKLVLLAAKKMEGPPHIAATKLAEKQSQKDRGLTAPAVKLVHGQHFPTGFQAVEYAYGDKGTWKRLSSELHYTCNQHKEHASDSHPLDPETLETDCTTHHCTCCDLDGNLLCDPERAGHVRHSAVGVAAFAFHEHSGIGGGAGCTSKQVAKPRLLFSFDENVLGHCVSLIYHKPPPAGVEATSVIHMNKTFCRCGLLQSVAVCCTLLHSVSVSVGVEATIVIHMNKAFCRRSVLQRVAAC